MLDRKALLAAILITLLLVGYAFTTGVRIKDYSYKVEITPWSGSYTPVEYMPYVTTGELLEIIT